MNKNSETAVSLNENNIQQKDNFGLLTVEDVLVLGNPDLDKISKMITALDGKLLSDNIPLSDSEKIQTELVRLRLKFKNILEVEKFEREMGIVEEMSSVEGVIIDYRDVIWN